MVKDDRPPPPDEEEFEAEELSDEEIWCPEPTPYEDSFLMEEKEKALGRIARVRPSEFTSFAFRMPMANGYEPFSFEGRRHMKRCYDTPAKRVLLVFARQTEKSTLLGNTALCYSCLVPACKTLYVSPSATQTKTFSLDRIKEPIETSEVLRSFTTTMLSQNIFEKQFVNRSKITLRYAFLNADRTRGISAWRLLLDEFQDILSDNIPIIEQCTSHAPEEHKRFVYSGTPKSLDNNIEYYRSGTTKHGVSMSTMGEWVVPCDRCGSSAGAGRFWNILGEKNIAKKGLSCERCGQLIDKMHPDAQWAFQVENGVFESYRVPQLMVPWRPWDEILLDYSRYPRDRFYNEVLGLSFDSGMRPLTTQQVKECCKETISMHPSHLERYMKMAYGQSFFAGIDWGTGENSYTVMTLGTYVDMKFRIIYIHRFTGEDTTPVVQLKKIEDIIKAFNVHVIGCDYGGGFDRNDHLIRKFGNRVAKYQYMARAKKKIEYDTKLRRYKVHRTEVMSDIFNAIKRQQFEFPRWLEFQEPYARDMLNIFSEYNETLRMVQYEHRQDKPDDSFHSILYCFLASLAVQPRPDIIAPIKEEPNQGPRWGGYTGPVNQG